jgi:hypothetical protein
MQEIGACPADACRSAGDQRHPWYALHVVLLSGTLIRILVRPPAVISQSGAGMLWDHRDERDVHADCPAYPANLA